MGLVHMLGVGGRGGGLRGFSKVSSMNLVLIEGGHWGVEGSVSKMVGRMGRVWMDGTRMGQRYMAIGSSSQLRRRGGHGATTSEGLGKGVVTAQHALSTVGSEWVKKGHGSGMTSARLVATTSFTPEDAARRAGVPRAFDWITQEAEELIARAYNRHKALLDKSTNYPEPLSVQQLESKMGPFHYKPKDVVDRVALGLMQVLRVFTHAFFRTKYDHHAVVLETVAAVPGVVGSFHRHLRSLRRMERDHGWIGPLQEESENERMHLLIWMKTCQPTRLERLLVMGAQFAYTAFYTGVYFVSPRSAHRMVGYLEEEAFQAYTSFLEAIDRGDIPNRPAPEIAINYYRLSPDARLRDVVLHVRADEAMHRDMNHHLGDKYFNRDLSSPPSFMGHDLRAQEAIDNDEPADHRRDK
uniref:Alternative oxidase n=1 Tax=Compsopogon caeruleus TaxID=31354 RepID=A0A7S1XCA3_9RHOD|mmetsp:Transcript_12652/g.25666  ORF Transcript_12652/g.25666 Transcript_12652/m.25666 type:complete len:411 (+) Transcript_12652:179-1411(+)